MLVSYLAFEAFAPVNIALEMLPLFCLLVFVFPFFFAGEVFYRVLESYPREWSYFLSLVNQLALFLYLLVLSGANDPANAWNVVWLLLITLYLINIFVLVMSVGLEYLKKISIISLAQPAVLALVFYGFLGQTLEISIHNYAFSLVSFIAAGGFLISLFFVVNYLIRSNTDVSAFQLTSGLLQNHREALNLGFESKPLVQTLKVDNGEESVFLAPWVHPGPLAGFGGGILSEKIISELNSDGRGFFMHVPCTHKEDLADPDDAEKLLDAESDPDMSREVSEMIHEEYENIDFYGRKTTSGKIVLMEAEGIDDYDVGVFHENIDREDVLLVDLHNHDIHEGPEKEIQYGTVQAEKLRESFEDFLDELDDLDLYSYHAGMKVSEEGQMMAWTEKVGSQETLLIGSDTNGLTEDMRSLREKYDSNFDHSLIFSTDTHASIHEMANPSKTDIDDIERLVESSKKELDSASLGLSASKSEPVRLLKYDYNGLVSSVNILVRLLPIALLIFYLLLIIWVF
jgi:putative membrane protein